jgi:hypothetical protein
VEDEDRSSDAPPGRKDEEMAVNKVELKEEPEAEAVMESKSLGTLRTIMNLLETLPQVHRERIVRTVAVFYQIGLDDGR